MRMNNYHLSDLSPGLTETFEVTVGAEMLQMFAQMTGDYNPLHCDPEYAKRKGYDQNIVYGMLTASFLSTLAGMYLPGEHSLIQAVEAKFLKPVFVGDRLSVSGTIAEIHENFGMIILKIRILNQKKEHVLKGKMQIGLI